MLVLTRRQGESIIIGDGIKLTVVSVGPGRVKIGITAPPDVRINREEIHTRLQQELLQQEHGTDVLAVVSSEVVDSACDQCTIVNSAADTGILKNDATLRSGEQHNPVQNTGTTAATPRAPKFRPPRKPR
jgi:carbon storage regulator